MKIQRFRFCYIDEDRGYLLTEDLNIITAKGNTLHIGSSYQKVKSASIFVLMSNGADSSGFHLQVRDETAISCLQIRNWDVRETPGIRRVELASCKEEKIVPMLFSPVVATKVAHKCQNDWFINQYLGVVKEEPSFSMFSIMDRWKIHSIPKDGYKLYFWVDTILGLMIRVNLNSRTSSLFNWRPPRDLAPQGDYRWLFTLWHFKEPYENQYLIRPWASVVQLCWYNNNWGNSGNLILRECGGSQLLRLRMVCVPRIEDI